jgi:hypothetical protein
MHERLVSCLADQQGRQAFHDFLVKFGVARCITRDAKPLLLTEYVTNWRSTWTEARPSDHAAYDTVDRFARLQDQKDWAARRGSILTSLASKLAFMANPTVFVPYDATARAGLTKFGYPVRVHDFAAYMDAFDKVGSRMPSELATDSATLAASMARRTTPELLRLRIIDKLLMREGGFEDEADA